MEGGCDEEMDIHRVDLFIKLRVIVFRVGKNENQQIHSIIEYHRSN